MIIHRVETVIENGRARVSAMVSLETPGLLFVSSGTGDLELWIDWPADYFTPQTQDASAFILICLPLAMSLGERIVTRDPIPEQLLLNILEAMAIYKSYFPKKCDVIKLEVATHRTAKNTNDRVGSFYSGGVDSLYNIAELQRLARVFGVGSVTDLWLIQGMDIPLSDDVFWAEAKDTLMSPFASEESIQCVDIRTNARAIHDRFVDWEALGFSAILGGIAKCFSPIIGMALIGSYGPYDAIKPHSSSPLVDPMWSCDRQLIRHFSCRVNRLEKLQTILIETPDLLENLRVCYLNPNGAYNCGRCEKCLRTQLQLLINNSLDRCARFDERLSVQSLRHLKLPWRAKNQYAWDFWHDIRQACREAGLVEYDRAIGRQLLRIGIWRAAKRFGACVLRRS